MSVASKPSGRPRGFAPLDYALYAIAVLVWGLSWIALHYQVGEVAPEVSIVWRFAISAPLMLAFAAWRGERLAFDLADHVHFAALGAAIFSTNYALFYYAGVTIASGLLSIVFSLAAIGNVAIGSRPLAAILQIEHRPVKRRIAVGDDRRNRGLPPKLPRRAVDGGDQAFGFNLCRGWPGGPRELRCRRQ